MWKASKLCPCLKKKEMREKTVTNIKLNISKSITNIHENTNIIHIYTSLNFKLKLRTVLFSITETGRFSGIKSVEDTFRKDNCISSWRASKCILAPSSVIVKPIISWWEISDRCNENKIEIATIEDSFRNTFLH